MEGVRLCHSETKGDTILLCCDFCSPNWHHRSPSHKSEARLKSDKHGNKIWFIIHLQTPQEECHTFTHLSHERWQMINLNHIMQGSVIPVVLDLTANHQGWFTFKICPNNDIWYQNISSWAYPTIQLQGRPRAVLLWLVPSSRGQG